MLSALATAMPSADARLVEGRQQPGVALGAPRGEQLDGRGAPPAGAPAPAPSPSRTITSWPAYCSRQPRAPQEHNRPPECTVTCPISPLHPRRRGRSRRRATMPAPMPTSPEMCRKVAGRARRRAARPSPPGSPRCRSRSAGRRAPRDGEQRRRRRRCASRGWAPAATSRRHVDQSGQRDRGGHHAQALGRGRRERRAASAASAATTAPATGRAGRRRRRLDGARAEQIDDAHSDVVHVDLQAEPAGPRRRGPARPPAGRHRPASAGRARRRGGPREASTSPEAVARDSPVAAAMLRPRHRLGRRRRPGAARRAGCGPHRCACRHAAAGGRTVCGGSCP